MGVGLPTAANEVMEPGAAPTVAVSFSGLGTQPTVSLLAGSVDGAGKVTITAGLSLLTLNGTLTLTFSTPVRWNGIAPLPFLSPGSPAAAAALVSAYVSCPDTTKMVITFSGVSLGIGASMVFAYRVCGAAAP